MSPRTKRTEKKISGKSKREEVTVSFTSQLQEEFLKKGFAHQILVKTFHFQTPRGFHHKSVDTYFEQWNKNFDTFLEASQGLFGRVTARHINVNVATASDANMMKTALELYSKYLSSLPFSPQQSGLSTVRDQMLTDIHRLVYFLTFL